MQHCARAILRIFSSSRGSPATAEQRSTTLGRPWFTKTLHGHEGLGGRQAWALQRGQPTPEHVPASARETGPASQTHSQARSLLLRGHGPGTVGDRAAETPRHGGDVMSATAAQAAPRRLRPHPATTPRGGDAPAPPRHPPVAPRHAPAHATADAMRHRRRGPPGGRRAAVLTDGLEAGGSRGGCKASPVHPSCCMHLHAHAAPLSAHTAERAERAEWCVRRRRRTGPRARPYRPVSRCRARRWAARRPHAHKDIRNKTLVLRAAP